MNLVRTPLDQTLALLDGRGGADRDACSRIGCSTGGTVNLSPPCAREICRWAFPCSDRDACLGNVAPYGEGAVARGATFLSGRLLWIRNVKEVPDLIMNRQKPLRLSARLEAFHDPFASPGQLMRILRPIVQALVLAMFDAEPHLRPRSAV